MVSVRIGEIASLILETWRISRKLSEEIWVDVMVEKDIGCWTALEYLYIMIVVVRSHGVGY
jgi:hypothetical protein